MVSNINHYLLSFMQFITLSHFADMVDDETFHGNEPINDGLPKKQCPMCHINVIDRLFLHNFHYL